MRYDLSYFTRPDGVTIAYTAVGEGPPPHPGSGLDHAS